MRHFLAGAVGGLACGVVTPPGARRLVTAARRPLRSSLADIPARLAAVLLASVAATADVEDRRAVAAAALAEAVIEAVPGT